jgi:predicted O-methyltransferase YrrM
MIDSEIQSYAEKFTSDESDLLRELREKTFAERVDKSMLSGFYQGRMLSMISRMLAPRRILEIGTYMGYSALCLAEGLTDDGKLVTIDVEPSTQAIAKDFWLRSPLGAKIEAVLGDARDFLPSFGDEIDLVFIDADKTGYATYFDLVLPKLRTGGFILADNVLWSGRVLDTAANDDPDTIALSDFNEKINADPRVSNLLLAVRDGVMVIRKDCD